MNRPSRAIATCSRPRLRKSSSRRTRRPSSRLTPEQRRRVLEELSNQVPDAERVSVLRAGDSPDQLARVATRSEIRQPGVLERIFGGVGAAPGAAGPGFGTFFLGSMAGTVLGSMIAQQFFHANPDAAHLFGDTAGQGHGMSSPIEDRTTDNDTASLGDDSGGFDGGDSFDV